VTTPADRIRDNAIAQRVAAAQAYLDRWAIHELRRIAKDRPANRDLCRDLRRAALFALQYEKLDLDGVEVVARPHPTVYGAIDVRAVDARLIPLYEEPPIT
jgi:hypothetical protein